MKPCKGGCGTMTAQDYCYSCASKNQVVKHELEKKCINGSTGKCGGTIHLIEGRFICTNHFQAEYDASPNDNTAKFLLKAGEDSVWWKRATNKQRAYAMEYKRKNPNWLNEERAKDLRAKKIASEITNLSDVKVI